MPNDPPETVSTEVPPEQIEFGDAVALLGIVEGIQVELHHTFDQTVPIHICKQVSVVLTISRPKAGEAMPFLCEVVILGINKPSENELISTMADGSAVEPDELMAMRLVCASNSISLKPNKRIAVRIIYIFFILGEQFK